MSEMISISRTTGSSVHSTPFRKRILPAIWGHIRRAVITAVPNFILNRYSSLRAVPSVMVAQGLNLIPDRLDLDPADHMKFLSQYYPKWKEGFSDPFHKKFLELHVSWRLLDIRPNEAYLDLAGGLFTYAGYVNAGKKLLNDRYVNPSLRGELIRQGVEIVESFAQSMPLEDCSVDKISCHHSFEHFRDDGDTSAIREIQRVLRPRGKACIVPIFLANGYFEIVDLPWTPKSDQDAIRVVDPTSPFPGGSFSGGFARVYNLESFRKRVLQQIDVKHFRVAIVELFSKGKTLPDQSLPCHRTDPAIDFPYRALLIERNAT
jgi:SAM-dependent methyltransferase